MRKLFITTTFLLSSFLQIVAQSENTTNAKNNYPDTAWEHYAADNYAGGTGTEEDPYLISTPEQFMKLVVEIENLAAVDENWDGEYSKGKYWKQTEDLVFNENVLGRTSYDEYDDLSIIDATGLRTYDGIGYNSSEYDYQRFSGTYDGDGHSISGIYIKGGKSSTGLFNFVEGGVIKNLVIKDSYFSANANVGLIVGSADATTILNCQTSGVIYCGGSYHAGIAGCITNGSKVLNCVTDAWTWAKNNCAGLVGTGRNSSIISNCYFGGWLGGVGSNLAKFQWWGTVCPELGKSEITTTIPDPTPEDPEHVIEICDNPSKAQNCYWTDTCTVRHKRAGLNWMKAEAYNDADNCTFGVFENCKPVTLADMAPTVETLNANASGIDGACSWIVGSNGLPALKFDATSGISSVTGADESHSLFNVYSIQGVMVKAGVTETDALNGLSEGVYIVNGKKHVIK